MESAKLYVRPVKESIGLEFRRGHPETAGHFPNRLFPKPLEPVRQFRALLSLVRELADEQHRQIRNWAVGGFSWVEAR
jgi:hypothetical protein